MQIYMALELNRQEFGRHRQMKQKDADKAKKHCTKTMQSSEKFNKWKPNFIKMLRNYDSTWDGHLGEVAIVRHRIVLYLLDEPSIHSDAYRAAPIQRELERKEVSQMGRTGIAKPAVAERTAPIAFVPKKEIILCFLVSYRQLILVIVHDSYSIPCMVEHIDSLGEARLCPTLNDNSGYRQIKIYGNDVNKAAFVTNGGLYDYFRMPFEMESAPATFQRAIGVLLAIVKRPYAPVYIDDMIVIIEDTEGTPTTYP